jgi:hypothetical protein
LIFSINGKVRKITAIFKVSQGARNAHELFFIPRRAKQVRVLKHHLDTRRITDRTPFGQGRTTEQVNELFAADRLRSFVSKVQCSSRSLFRRRDFRADGAFETCPRGVVIVQCLHLCAARLGKRIFGIQHVELGAGAGVGAGVGFA